jgi:hypothetical protein
MPLCPSITKKKKKKKRLSETSVIEKYAEQICFETNHITAAILLTYLPSEGSNPNR